MFPTARQCGTIRDRIAPAAARVISRRGAALLQGQVASKYRSVLAGIASDTLVADMRAVKGNIKLLPHDCDWYYAARPTWHSALLAPRGNVALIPWIFHLIAIFIIAIGAGPAVSTTLLAPIAMQVTAEAGISPLLVGVMLVHGSHGGAYSPVSAMGVIANGAVAKAGLPDLSGTLFLNSLVFNILIAIAAYLLFGGLKLIRRSREEVMSDKLKALMETGSEQPLTFQQKATLAGIAALFVLGLGFKYHVGFSAFAIGVVLSLLAPKEERKAVEQMAWPTIIMISGVLTLVALMAKVGAIDLIARGIGQVATPLTAPLLLAGAGGVISLYSATGAVLAALIPMVPAVLAAVGGGNVVGAVSSLVIASSVVDTSPLSIQGAMLLASVKNMDRNTFFKQLLLWGIAMIFVGTVLSWLIFVVIGLP